MPDSRMWRWCGLLCWGIAAAGCGADRVTAPSLALPASLVLHRAADQALPALIDHYDTAEGRVDLYIVTDTLTLGADGKYRQRGLVEARIGPRVVARPIWSDHGRYTIAGTALHAESDYVLLVTFDGVIEAGGQLRIRQDLIGDGTAVDYELGPTR